MSEEQQPPAVPGGETAEVYPPALEPSDDPLERSHWAYREMLVMIMVAALSLLTAGQIAVTLYMRFVGAMDLPTAIKNLSSDPYWVLLVQFASWVPVLFYIYFVVVRRYKRGFGEGVGWLPLKHPPAHYIATGALLVLSVTLMALVVAIPDQSYPMLELFEDPDALWILGAFGVLVAPAIEEIVFRGFLFSGLEHIHGTGVALVVTSVVFSLVHGSQYGWQWQNLLILLWVGLILGAIRAQTQSTKATTLVHASYNGLLFAILIFGPEQLQ
jgi:membrane protease YdiL (CAAX protease family)